MNCPYCNSPSPKNSLTCKTCGKRLPLDREVSQGQDFVTPPPAALTKKRHRFFNYKKTLSRKAVFILFGIILALCITACSSSNRIFTLDSIKTKNAGFSGFSSSGLSASNIYFEGKIGLKTYEIQLTKAFENYTVDSFSGEYKEESVTSFNPEIESLSLKLKDPEGNLLELTVSSGDTFTADIQDGKAVILLPEE
ncbi:MAG: hypothetical protein ACTTK0_04830 [Stomatobaculum sp.]